MPAIRSAEWALPGHPDKRCDAIADAIVGRALAIDPSARARVDVMLAGDEVFVAGQVAFSFPAVGFDVGRVVRDAVASTAGTAGEPAQRPTVHAGVIISQQPAAVRGDRALAIGYAVDRRTTASLPPERWLVERIARELSDGAGLAHADGTVLVTIEESDGRWQPLAARIELHARRSESDAALRLRVAAAVERACTGLPAVPSVEVIVHEAGRGWRPGASNRWVAEETYGPRVRCSSVARHGRDLTEPGHAASVLARQVALWLVRDQAAPEAEVEVAWEPGATVPARITATVLGTRREVTPPFATDVRELARRRAAGPAGRRVAAALAAPADPKINLTPFLTPFPGTANPARALG
jgi:S-adenosylmethionine synthetase